MLEVALLKMIQHAKDAELTFPECLDELDKYAQKILDGEPVDGVLAQVREHLEACPCCNDQFRLMLATLDTIDES